MDTVESTPVQDPPEFECATCGKTYELTEDWDDEKWCSRTCASYCFCGCQDHLIWPSK